MSSLIFPPSPNWFLHNAICSRTQDRLLVGSCFKLIVVYKVPEEKGTPKVLKVIPYQHGKVTGVALVGDPLHPRLGHAVATIGDHSTLSLFDMHDGALLAQQQTPQQTPHKAPLNSVCWGAVRGEDVVCAVGDKGYVAVWQPFYRVVTSFTMETRKNLSVVEALPSSKGEEVLVASDRTVLRISLHTGEVMQQYKGHDSPIYCLRIYPGTRDPRAVDALKTNTRWRRDEDEEDKADSSPSKKDTEQEDGEGGSAPSAAASGPFFATSDLGRNILVWDLEAKRYLASVLVPVSGGGGGNRKVFKDRPQSFKNFHIALHWARDRLYSSTVTGEVLEWNLAAMPEPKYRVLTHRHTRVIYNMLVLENVLVTYSQDRLLQAYDIAANSVFFSIPTMGNCAHSLAFSPHDANRLAIGMQDEAIKVLTLSGDSPLKTQTIYQNIKGKVLSLSWHPGQEGKLLFGTSEGQVGVADVFSTKVTSFAYFHQKPAYKVEWGMAVAPNKTGVRDDWCAYSFGDRELLCRSPNNFMQDPVELNACLSLAKSANAGFCLSEFAFSPDYQFLALGSLNGEVKIMSRLTASCLVVISRARKVIQHLAWKPPTSAHHLPCVLGVASAENSVLIYDLEQELKETETPREEPLSLSHPKRELCAHAGRVIWLSWSPHTDGLLASSSYDHTVQIWNANTGEPIANYGGHSHRVFRAEFSPLGPDKVISFAEENCIHAWQPSLLTARIPSESAATSREVKKKSRPGAAADKDDESRRPTTSLQTESPSAANTPSEASATRAGHPAPPSASTTSTSTSSTALAKRTNARRSSFPLFHTVSSRKKSFYHMCLFSLFEEGKVANSSRKTLPKEEEEEDLDEDNELEEVEEVKVPNGVPAPPPSEGGGGPPESPVSVALRNYAHFIPPDQSAPEAEDVQFYLDFFGSLPRIDSVVKKEICNHERTENLSRANLMHVWQGSLEGHIKWAAKHKQLDAFLVAAAPQVSFSLWEYACEAYAEQLVEADDPVTAATYLISIHKDSEAVQLLTKRKFFREALCLARYRLGFDADAIHGVLAAWCATTVFEGNFELAALLQLCMGSTEGAARTLARRTEPHSLVVSAFLFQAAECHTMALSTAVLAFEEAEARHDFFKFQPILRHMPHLEWCKCIHICHQSILDHIAAYKKGLTSQGDPSPIATEEEGTKENGDPSCPPIMETSVLKTVVRRWEANGILAPSYAKHSKDIREHLITQKIPSSLKHLWFLNSILLSEMLLEGLGELKPEEDPEVTSRLHSHLDATLKSVSFWGKTDQIYYLTHLLLPNGVADLSTLEVPLLTDAKESLVINQLQELYISSEAKTILSLLESDETYVPWSEEARRPMEVARNGHASAALNDDDDDGATKEEVVVKGSEGEVRGKDVEEGRNGLVEGCEKEDGTTRSQEKPKTEEERQTVTEEENKRETVTEEVNKRETVTEEEDKRQPVAETERKTVVITEAVSFQEKTSSNLYLFKCEDDFATAFRLYLGDSMKSLSEETTVNEERSKTLSNVLSCLHQRSKINSNLFLSLLGNVESLNE